MALLGFTRRDAMLLSLPVLWSVITFGAFLAYWHCFLDSLRSAQC